MKARANCFLLSLFGILMHTCAVAQQPVFWLGPEMVVSTGSTYGSIRPRVVLVSGNIPLVMWGRSGGNIYVSRWNGSSFPAPQQVNPAGVFAYVGGVEGPNIEARGDTVFITFFSTPTNASKIYSIASYNGGLTWQDTVRVDNQSTLKPYTPDVAIQPGGNPFITFEVSTSTFTLPNQLFSRSTDGGLSFTTEIAVTDSAPGLPCECCPPNIAVHDSLVYVTYRNNVNNIRNMYTAVSTDYGNTFEKVVQIDNSNWFINGCPTQPPDAMTTSDSLFAVWMTVQSNNEPRVILGAMDHATHTASPYRIVDYQMTGILTQRYPSIGGNEDTLAVAWEDNRYNGNFDCYVTFSLNGASDLGAQVVPLSDSVSSLTGNQVTPHLDYANGAFHFVYQNASTNSVIYRKATISAVGMGDATDTDPLQVSIQDQCNGFLQVKIFTNDNCEYSVQLLDISGRNLWQSTGRENILSIPVQPSAAYFLQVISEKGKVVKKLVRSCR